MKLRRPASEVLLLNSTEVATLLDLRAALEAAEIAFRAYANKSGQVFPLVRERIGENSVFGIKSGLWSDVDVIGLKTGGYWPANLAAGWDRHQAVMLLVDQLSGRPIAFLDGNAITRQRTAAAGALAVKTLANPNATEAVIVGGGVQAEAQAEALVLVAPTLKRISVWSRRPEQAQTLVRRLRARDIAASAAEDLVAAVKRSTIIVTVTGSRESLIQSEWVAPGTHINAMGADTAGKHEIASVLLERSTVVVDDWTQARRLGECQHLPDDVQPKATLGEVLLGKAAGRPDPASITVFDSTGIALQDIVAAVLVCERAQDGDVGIRVRW